VDIIFIRDLHIETVIGIHAWERKVKQIVHIDLEFGADIAAAAASDNIEHTVSYQAVADRLTDYVGGSEFLLVETLAERIAELLQNEFGLSWLHLTISKPGAVRNARAVGVIIERGRRE